MYACAPGIRCRTGKKNFYKESCMHERIRCKALEDKLMTAREAAWLRESRRQAVIDYLTDHVSAPEAELCAALRLPEGLCGELLYAL